MRGATPLFTQLSSWSWAELSTRTVPLPLHRNTWWRALVHSGRNVSCYRFWKSLLYVIFIACIGSIWLVDNGCRVIITSCRTHTHTHKHIRSYIKWYVCICSFEFIMCMYWFQNGVNTDSSLTVREAAFDGISQWVYSSMYLTEVLDIFWYLELCILRH
jgi:hypothetical protein